MMKMLTLLASLLAMAIPLTSNAAGKHLTAKGMTPELRCPVKGSGSTALLLDAAMAKHGIRAEGTTTEWMNATFPNFGLQPSLPDTPAARALALRTLALAQKGAIVAAKLSHEDALQDLAYRQTVFAAAIAHFLSAIVQPVHHGAEDDHVQGGKDDLEAASKSLEKVILKVHAARGIADNLYAHAPVRFFILGHAFDDPVAVEVSRVLACRLPMSSSDLAKVSMAARKAKAR